MVETNRYANSFIDNNPSTRAWTDTTVEELKAFVGLLIFDGYCQASSIRTVLVY